MKKLILIVFFSFTIVSNCFAEFIKIEGKYVDTNKFSTFSCDWSFGDYILYGYTGEATTNWFSGQSKIKIALSTVYPSEQKCLEELEKAFNK
jgi:hypothetical protein